MNRALPVFSLQDQDQLVILYGGTNVAVMYDQTSNSQHVLQVRPSSCLNVLTKVRSRQKPVGIGSECYVYAVRNASVQWQR